MIATKGAARDKRESMFGWLKPFTYAQDFCAHCLAFISSRSVNIDALHVAAVEDCKPGVQH